MPPSDPDFLTKLGGESLEFIVTTARSREGVILARIDAAIQAGERDLGKVTVDAFKAHVPLVGGSIGAALADEMGTLTAQAEMTAKSVFDRALAILEAKALAMEGLPPAPEVAATV